MEYVQYDRKKAVDYAEKWALGRNPEYYDYSDIGGDCTAFASQCVYAGSGIMNYSSELGWYYVDGNDKSPSWSGVEFFYDFMVNNHGVGPVAETVRLRYALPGDIIQFANAAGDFYHTVVLTDIVKNRRGTNYYVCSHSRDAYHKNLFSYNFYEFRCIHILEVGRS